MSSTLAWGCLILAGFFEVCWAIGLKYTGGFTQMIPSVFTLVTLCLSMFFLAKSLEVLPLGLAYGIWVGIGVVGTSIGGILLFQESFSAYRLIFLGLLIVSIVGLKVTSA